MTEIEKEYWKDREALLRKLQAAYDKGFTDALRSYAHWKDGVQYVGTCGTTLAHAVDSRYHNFEYKPPPAAEEPTP